MAGTVRNISVLETHTPGGEPLQTCKRGKKEGSTSNWAGAPGGLQKGETSPVAPKNWGGVGALLAQIILRHQGCLAWLRLLWVFIDYLED